MAPMIERRPFHELPSEDLGWLKARRHFSTGARDDPNGLFADYLADPGGFHNRNGWETDQ